MDDSLVPSASAGPADDSDVEEDVPDWTALAKLTAKHGGDNAAPFIPKRGEKDFAPLTESASKQAKALEASRSAMYSALKAGEARQHSSKSYNKATWHPDIQVASMDVQGAHGVQFQTTGRYSSERHRIELLPEETLYLVERGGLECWTEEGIAMSTQHVWAVTFGGGSLSLEQYQVYAYLRRLGYSVHRASMGYQAKDPISAAFSSSTLWSRVWQRLRSVFTWPIHVLHRFGYHTALVGTLVRRILPLKPVTNSLLSGVRWNTYSQAFEALRIIPSPQTPIEEERKSRLADSYKVFWHVYKPSRKYKKTELPPPDFSVVVLDGSTTSMPTLDQIELMMDTKAPSLAPAFQERRTSLMERLKRFLGYGTVRRKNLYPILKSPQGQVMLAVVDQGTSYFLRLTRPCFGAHPWI